MCEWRGERYYMGGMAPCFALGGDTQVQVSVWIEVEAKVVSGNESRIRRTLGAALPLDNAHNEAS